MPDTEPIAGTADVVGTQAERAEIVRETARQIFRRHGYEPVEPPVLERAAPFLDRSGEDIRTRMYIFSDPAGREICLRPELTIPTARLFADRLPGEGRPFRAYYSGPVFRYGRTGEGRFRQFNQLGAELIGEPDEALADAEVLALALALLSGVGVTEHSVAVSDVSVFSGLAQDERLSPSWRARLLRSAPDPTALRVLIDHSTGTTESSATAGIHQALRGVSEHDRDTVLRSLLQDRATTEGTGSRDIDDIVHRTLDRLSEAEGGGLPPVLVDAITELLAIRAPVQEAMERVRTVARAIGSAPILASMTSWERRLERIEAFGIDTTELTMDLSLRRGIAYYSHFIFAVHMPGAAASSLLCAGGRYNDLVATVGGRSSPAVGFAIGLERLVLHLERSAAPVQVPVPEVYVVTGGEIAEVEGIRVATTLRAHGVATEFLNGRRVRYAINAALKRGVRYVAIAGEAEAASDVIVLRDLQSRAQSTLPADEGARKVIDDRTSS